jgi:hypothetical protein
VPFKGNAEVLNALLGGHVKSHFALTASTLQHVRSGALRVLAVTTEKRLPDCRMCRPSPSSAIPATRSARGRACLLRPARRRRSSGGSSRDRGDAQDAGGAGADHREGAIPIGSSPEDFAARFGTKSRSGQAGQGAARLAKRRGLPSAPGGTMRKLWFANSSPPLRWLVVRARSRVGRARDYPNRAIPSWCRSRPAGPAMSPRDLLSQRMNEDWGQPVDRG